MIDIEEIKKYLPYYLNDKERQSLLQELKNYPENLDGRIFTTYLKDEQNIFQGDGFQEFLFVNLPDSNVGKLPAMVLSNTCDISLTNERLIKKNKKDEEIELSNQVFSAINRVLRKSYLMAFKMSGRSRSQKEKNRKDTSSFSLVFNFKILSLLK